MTTPLTVGDRLPVQSRHVGFPNWNRFAAVNFEFMPIHMDDDIGRAAGYPTAIGMGLLHWSYMHILMREFLDHHGRIVGLHCRFQGATIRNTTVSAHAEVATVEEVDGARRIGFTVWIEDEAGNRLTDGSATVEQAG